MVEVNEIDEIFLGTLLVNSSDIYSVIDKVSPKMLDGEINQIVYRCIVKLAKNGVDISRVIVKNELLISGLFTNIGGDGYLDYLVLKASSDPIDNYANAIVENYKRREIIRFAVRLQKLGTLDSSETISKASTFLNNLSSLGGNVEDVLFLGDTLDSTILEIQSRIDNPGIQGIPTGYKKIDLSTTGYRPGELWFVGARPSMGKTAFLLKSLLAVAKSGRPALIVNREMILSGINERLLSMESGIPFSRIRDGNLSKQQIDILSSTKDELKKLPLYIDNNWSGNTDYVLSIIKKYKQLKNLSVVGIDYIQLLVERGEDSMHELGKLSRSLKLIAGELGITVIVLSQLNRKLEERQDKRPQMYDLRQAGYLEEDGDYMIGLYRDEVYRINSPDAGKIEFIIRKARNSGLETIMLGFDGSTVNVYDLDDMKKLR